jgi:hypothetical protein
MDLDIDTARLRPALRGRKRNLRTCAICGTPTINTTRCPAHQLERAPRQARGYDADHDRLRRELDPTVMAGHTPCAICGNLIHTGDDWHLAHNPDRTGYLGPAHAACNCNTAKPGVATIHPGTPKNRSVQNDPRTPRKSAARDS